MRLVCGLRAALLAFGLAPALVLAAGVSVRFDLSSPETAPFPSDRFSVADWTQRTFRRVDLPQPDCSVRPSDCADIEVINTLDGFSTQPRITVPFTGAIDPATATSDTIYLVNLGDTLTLRGFGQRVGINQVSWEPATNTLSFESDELLAEHSRYLLVVTTGVKDAAGDPIDPGPFRRFRHDLNFGHARDARLAGYRKGLIDAMGTQHGPRERFAALSLFTTQSATVELQKIARQIKASAPAPATFMVGNGGTARALFPLNDVLAIQFSRQVGTATFANSFLPTPALSVVPGAVAAVAYGRFSSPDYQTADKYIPATGTLTGRPQPQSVQDVHFQLFLPAGAKPAGGWPVVVFGHGFTDSMYGAPWTVASVFASRGLATLSINVVGHGGGAAGTLAVLPACGCTPPVVVPAGGRGIDQDGNGTIDSTEGVNAAPPRTIIGSRDGLRQTVADLLQLVRQIQVGIDADGDGGADLDASRIYYAGQSFGGIYGTILLGVAADIRAGVPNVPGGSISEVARLGVFRGLTALALGSRVPSLLNGGALGFNENIPLRDEPVRINTVPGASAIQQVIERNEWVQQAGNPVSYAPYIRRSPLPGNAPKPVLFQFARGDTVVPNPTTSAILRAGALADVATYFRNDLAYAATPAVGKSGHTFLTNLTSGAAYAVAAQAQMAVFFATDGAQVIDPDGAGPFFETPIAGPLPETLNFIP